MTKGNKATAPAPPTRSLTDDEFQKLKPLGQRLSEWRRGRRAERASRPKRPVHIHLGGAKTPGHPAASTKRRATRLPRGHTYSRRRPKRGTLASILGVAVAAAVLTCAVVELVSWTAASELTLAAEGVSMLTAYAFGEPSDKAKLKKAQQTGQAPKPSRQRTPAQPPAKSAGHKCGAPTQDGSACQRPVKNASDHCWEHPGGQGTGKPKTASTNGSGPVPKRTSKKGTAPPVPATLTS